MDSSTITLWTGSFPFLGVSYVYFIYLFIFFLFVCLFVFGGEGWLLVIIQIPADNANSVDSDQTPHSAMSDLGLHYFMGR